MPNPSIPAEVIASHGRHVVAQDQTGKHWQVFGKGKKREMAVGDQVLIEPSGDNQAWVTRIENRRNLVYRSDAIRSKLFASNLDQVVLVLAVSPPYSGELLGRTLLASIAAEVPLRIVFNKKDLIEQDPELQEALVQELTEWTDGEVPVHWLSLTEDREAALLEMQAILNNQTSLILGQSGMGKSTLINLLIPHAKAPTNEISMALNAGKHTTTHTQMHFGQDGLRLIDSPGFQAFGLHHLNRDKLLLAFPEIQAASRHCRFDDCRHINEPHCAVKMALNEGAISEVRYSFYLQMCDEIALAERTW
ncbi:MAG: ribosome small subunit-dependent GTPase A [Limnobacter sp.]|nr:ribosome small subunit-dependent GTPase A [Limnobacter sp.]